MTHTPGPWELKKRGDVVEVVGANGRIVCDNEAYYPSSVHPEDARLIAAAPELLESCQSLLDCIEAIERGEQDWFEYHQVRTDAAETINNARAEAQP